MGKIEDFINAVKNIKEDKERIERKDEMSYMSYMENWLCVHATNYKPKKNKNGQLSIQTTAMASGNKMARATVHVTLNHIVGGHMFGNWDSMPIVILAPYNDVVKENCEPAMVCVKDTYFIPNPDTGLVLPKSTCIVKPDNRTLFNIGDNVATYKTDHFTDEEIETILSLRSGWREIYDKYANGDISENEVEWALNSAGADYYKRSMQAYKKSKDKRAFARGLFEETRILILTTFLREYVVRMMMKKMGYKYLEHESGDVMDVVADKAKEAGLPNDAWGKAHSGSLEHKLEDTWGRFDYLLNILSKKSIEDVYVEELEKTNWLATDNPTTVIAESILSDTIPDFYNHYVQTAISFAKQYPSNFQEPKDNFIATYNQNLDTMLRRNASRMTQEYIKMINKLKQQDKERYEDLLYALKRDKQEQFTKLANRNNPQYRQ